MELGVCYYPEQWPQALWEKDALEMKNLGLSIVRIGEFAWSKLEPKEGVYQFEWLDRSIKILGDAGLKIILGTPSATPPSWVLHKFPDMLGYDMGGRPRKFGSRRHYCFSHQGYKELAAKMAEKLSKRYGSNPTIMAWQVDNEYGCHDTTRSYSPIAEKAFQKWLLQKYQSIEILNERWGNTFWSMEYSNFDEIALPMLTVTEANPIHRLDFHRFSSDQVVQWNKAQVTAIRHGSNLPIMHNYMGRITDFDHFQLGEDLDFATWDSYPLGFLEDRSDRSKAFKAQHQFCGDPDFQAFHHDLYRSVGRGRWAVMEQQPGPVNWAPYNPAPDPGVVKMWALEAKAHGAEFLAFFRWRQAPFAQEQMHTALKRADNEPAKAYDEIKELVKALDQIQKLHENENDVALVFDYESHWAWEVQPQGQDFNYFKLVFAYYCALRKLGVSLDIISADSTNIKKYKLVCLPGLFNISEALSRKIKSHQGQILFGPRSHTKTEDFKLNIDSVSKIFDKEIKLTQVQTFRKGTKKTFKDFGTFEIWTEELTLDGIPSEPILSLGNKSYLTGWPDEETLIKILSTTLSRAGISHKRLADNIRREGPWEFNYLEGKVSYENKNTK